MPSPTPAGASASNQGSDPGPPASRRLMNFGQVQAKLGLQERATHRVVAEDWFPAPVVLGPRVRRWFEDEVDEALAQRAPRRTEPQGEPAQLRAGRAKALKVARASA